MSPACVARRGGHALVVRDWGRGPPVLLMAGWAMDSRIWGETMPAQNETGLRTIAEADLTPETAALKLPALVVHGDRDVSAPVEASAHRYAAIIPHAELIVYEGVAYDLMVTDAARLAADPAQRIGQ